MCIYNTRHADERIIYDDGSLLVHQARICHRAHRSPASGLSDAFRRDHTTRPARTSSPPFDLFIYFPLSLSLYFSSPLFISFRFYLINQTARLTKTKKYLIHVISPPASTCGQRNAHLHQIISKRNDDTTRQPPFTCRKTYADVALRSTATYSSNVRLPICSVFLISL